MSFIEKDNPLMCRKTGNHTFKNKRDALDAAYSRMPYFISFCHKNRIFWMLKQSLTMVFLILFLGGVFTAADANPINPMPPQGPLPVIEVKMIEPFTPVFQDNFDRPEPVGHPPIHEIPPMPLPYDYKDDYEDDQPVDHGVPMIYDPRTNKTYAPELPEPGRFFLSSGKLPGYFGVDGNAEDHEPEDPAARPRSFSQDMEKINNVGDRPWRKNAKLIMKFEDVNGNVLTSWCSGSMIDASTVLTAGHCVYAHEPGGVVINSFAKSIWVYPGWDGTDEGVLAEKFGIGRGKVDLIGCNTGWVDNKNIDSDIAVVSLDRAVGMLTGWFGNAWGGNFLTWIMYQTYHSASYPGESCSLPGLHNGQDMYYWHGKFNAFWKQRLYIHTKGGCFNAVWGGMSGSGAYYKDGSHRYVHALNVASNRSSWGTYLKMWGGWANFMNNHFIPNVGRGGNFDLQPMRMYAGTKPIKAGGSTPVMGHTAMNPTNGSASGMWTFSVYLSTTETVTPNDTLLGTFSYARDFGPMGGVRIQSPSLTIPVNTPPGDYWIGVIYDYDTDFNWTNNDTSGWDAASITVLPADRGSLRAYIEPAAARNAGAMWRLTSGPDTDWKTSGSKVSNIPVGSYIVEFNSIFGWNSPSHVSVTVYKDITAKFTRVYTLRDTGSLEVNIEPSVAAIGGRWRLTDGPGTSTWPDQSWKTSGTTLSGIPVGTYTVEFKPVLGLSEPDKVIVHIMKDFTRLIKGTYTVGIKLNLDFSFVVPKMIYNPDTETYMELEVGFKFVGEQNGRLMWELDHVK